jgi:hypothetical protein
VWKKGRAKKLAWFWKKEFGEIIGAENGVLMTRFG